jgi:UPF0716 protein FxsA
MNPLLIFLLLFVGIPLLELYWLLEVGGAIGAFPTIFLVVFTAVLGGLMVRVQGFASAMRVRVAFSKGETPAIEMLAGSLLLVSGFLLLLPGFFTDIIGFLLLIPPLRQWLVLTLLQRMKVLHPQRPAGSQQESSPHRPQVIEGEYRREDEK